jgi:endonuclease V-like protein UPF0215 family
MTKNSTKIKKKEERISLIKLLRNILIIVTSKSLYMWHCTAERAKTKEVRHNFSLTSKKILGDILSVSK